MGKSYSSSTRSHKSAAMHTLAVCVSIPAMGCKCRIKYICWSHLLAGNVLNLGNSALQKPHHHWFLPGCTLRHRWCLVQSGAEETLLRFTADIVSARCVFNGLWLRETCIWLNMHLASLTHTQTLHWHSKQGQADKTTISCFAWKVGKKNKQFQTSWERSCCGWMSL